MGSPGPKSRADASASDDQRLSPAPRPSPSSADDDHVLQARQRGAQPPRELQVLAAAPAAGDHQHLRLTDAQDRGGLEFAVRDRDARIDGTELVDPEDQRPVLDPVRHHHRDRVACPHADVRQGGGGPGRRLVEFPVAEPLRCPVGAVADESIPVRVRRGGVSENRADRAAAPVTRRAEARHLRLGDRRLAAVHELGQRQCHVPSLPAR